MSGRSGQELPCAEQLFTPVMVISGLPHIQVAMRKEKRAVS